MKGLNEMKKLMMVFALGIGLCVHVSADTVGVATRGLVHLSADGSAVTPDTVAATAFPSELAENVIFHFDCSDTTGWTVGANGAVSKIPSTVGARYLTLDVDAEAGNWTGWGTKKPVAPTLVSAGGSLNGKPYLDFGNPGSMKALAFNAIADASTGNVASNILLDVKSIVAVWGSEHGGGWLGGGGYDDFSYSTGWKIFDAGYLWHRAPNPATGSSDWSYLSPLFTHPGSYSIARGRVWHDGYPSMPARVGFSGRWEVLSFVYGNTYTGYPPLQMTGLGINDARDGQSARSGGQEFAEIYIFDTALTDSERTAVEAYLQHKWFGIAPRGFNGNAEVGTLRVSPSVSDTPPNAISGTVSVGEGETLTVGELRGGHGDGTVIKSGEGRFVLGTSKDFGGNIRLDGGTLELPRRAVPTTLPGDVYMRFDATDLSTSETVVDGGTTYLAKWGNVAAMNIGGVAANTVKFKADSDAARPVLIPDALGVGKPAVDFGRFKSGRLMTACYKDADEAVTLTGITTAFMVVAPKGGGSSVFGNPGGSGSDFLDRGSDALDYANFTLPILRSGPDAGTHPTLAGADGVIYSNGRLLDRTSGYLSPGWQVVAMQVPGANVTKLGGSIRVATWGNGGFSICEIVLYTRTLSEREFRDVEAYLSAKWLGRALPGYADATASRVPEVKSLSVNVEGATVEVSGTGVAKVGTLTGSASFNKTGPGTLDMQAVSGKPSVALKDGTLKVGPITDSADSSVPAAGASFHLDASKSDSVELYTEGGVDYVVSWIDADGGDNAACAPRANKAFQPWLNTTDLCNGLPVVDFGENGSSRGLYFARNVDAIKSAFVVFGGQNWLSNGAGKDTGGHLFGTTTLSSDGSDGNFYDWHRDTSGGGALFIQSLYNAYPVAKYSSILVNGEEKTGAYVPTADYQLIEVHTPYGQNAGSLASRAGASFGWYPFGQSGGYRAGEILLYTRDLSDREKTATRNYLLKKWFGKTDAELAAIGGQPPETAAVALGTLTMEGGALESAGSVTVDGLSGDKGLKFSGGGILTVPDLSAVSGSMMVEAGKLAISAPTKIAAEVPGVPVEGKILHMDASSGVETGAEVTLGSTGKRVNKWSSSVGGVYAAPYEANGNPILVENGPNGLPYVYMRGRSWTSGSFDNSLRFFGVGGDRAVVSGMKTVFWVVGSQDGGGFLLGGGKHADTAEWSNFYRGSMHDDASGQNWRGMAGGAFAGAPILDTSRSQVSLRTADWRVNAESVNPTVAGLSGGWDLVSMTVSDDGTTTEAGGFAYNGAGDEGGYTDAWNREPNGWQALAEVIAYDRILTDEERLAVETYLSRKWGLGIYAKGDGKSVSVELAEGAKLDLAGGELAMSGVSGAGRVVNGAIAPAQLVADATATDWLTADSVIVTKETVIALRNVPAGVADRTFVRICRASAVVGSLRDVTFEGTVPEGIRPRLKLKDGWLGVQLNCGGLLLIFR